MVARLSKPVLSVIVPTLNEGDRIASFVMALQSLRSAGNEIIIVDGGSTDDSIQTLVSLCDAGNMTRLIHCAKGRARQMNEGARFATGQVLLFLHADTRLPDSALAELTDFCNRSANWGRFNVRLDNSGWPYKMIAWFINHRSRITGIATGDQAIFVKRDVFKHLGGYTDQPLMEDIDLSVRLKKTSSPMCLSSKVVSSARKWQQHGIAQTIWLMWRLRALYALGVSPEVLVKQYYRS